MCVFFVFFPFSFCCCFHTDYWTISISGFAEPIQCNVRPWYYVKSYIEDHAAIYPIQSIILVAMQTSNNNRHGLILMITDCLLLIAVELIFNSGMNTFLHHSLMWENHDSHLRYKTENQHDFPEAMRRQFSFYYDYKWM